MNLDRALQLNTAALAVMGALFLGLGHESVALPLALSLAAIVSVSLAYRFPWLRLNRLIANLIALAAVLWSLRNFLGIKSEDQLLAIADMLVYLQIVLLFQAKTARVYWQLVVLSLLQVVVAAALNLGPQFGLLLAAYMTMALSALVLLCLYRQWQKAPQPAAAAPLPEGRPWRQLLMEPVVTAPPDAASAALLARSTILSRQVALLAIATLVFAAVFFYATPRLHEGAWADMRGGTYATTGLASEVSLKESGRIHQSNHLVMRVTLSTVVKRDPYVLVGEPYFHGLALTEYVHDNAGGRWIAGRAPRVSPQIKPSPPKPAVVAVSNQVRQDVMLEGGALQLFAILPMHRLPETPIEIGERPYSGRLLRYQQPEESYARREYRYAIATSSLRNGRQLHAIPHRNPVLTEEDKTILKLERDQLLRFDRSRFAKLAAAADQIVREAGADQSDPFEQALALERYFLYPSRFRYSLSLDFARDKSLDPVEDFVLNHHTGHCEYFASALVLMLRSQGIPARMIVGYKGGEFNSIGSYYQVRQKHAHSWVEALLPAASVPKWELASETTASGNAWYRLDPTPSSSRLTTQREEEGVVTRVVQTFDYLELMWRDYVLSLNAAKQEDTIFEPVSSRALTSLPGWLDSRSFRRLWRWVSSLAGINLEVKSEADAAVSRVVDWRVGSVVMVLILLSLGLLQVAFVLWTVVRRLRGGKRNSSRASASGPPPFYRRLESLLSRLHLRRATGQTACELAATAAGCLKQAGAHAATAQLPAEIVDAYYRVRFGGAALDNDELAAIEHALVQLTPAVNLARQ